MSVFRKRLPVGLLAMPILALSLILVGAGCGKGAAKPAAGPAAAPKAAPVQGNQPQAVAPNEPAPVAPVAVGGCAHPYYPLKNGYQIYYAVSSAETKMNYSMRISDVTDTSAKLNISFDYPKPFSAVQDIVCNNGAISTKGYFDIGGAASGMMKTETKNVQGDIMPKDLAIGSAWTTKYEIVVSYQGVQLPPGMKNQFTGTVESANKVVAAEKVTVPAGTYDTLKVEETTTSVTNMPMSPAPVTSKSTSYQWWAKGVGMVKMQQEGAAKSTVEATKVVLP